MLDSSLFSEKSPLGGKIPSEELLPLVYDELRHLAARRMTTYGPAATLQPTALVHEAWLRLADVDDRCWNDKAHFFRTAAKAVSIHTHAPPARPGGMESTPFTP